MPSLGVSSTHSHFHLPAVGKDHVRGVAAEKNKNAGGAAGASGSDASDSDSVHLSDAARAGTVDASVPGDTSPVTSLSTGPGQASLPVTDLPNNSPPQSAGASASTLANDTVLPTTSAATPDSTVGMANASSPSTADNARGADAVSSSTGSSTSITTSPSTTGTDAAIAGDLTQAKLLLAGMTEQGLVGIGWMSEAEEAGTVVTLDSASFNVTSSSTSSAEVTSQLSSQQSAAGSSTSSATVAAAQASETTTVTLLGAGHAVTADGEIFDFQIQAQFIEGRIEGSQTTTAVSNTTQEQSDTASDGGTSASATSNNQITLGSNTFDVLPPSFVPVGDAPSNYALFKMASTTAPVSVQTVTTVGVGLVQTADGEIYGYQPYVTTPAPLAQGNIQLVGGAGGVQSDPSTVAATSDADNAAATEATNNATAGPAANPSIEASTGLASAGASTFTMSDWNSALNQTIELFALLNSLTGFGEAGSAASPAAKAQDYKTIGGKGLS